MQASVNHRNFNIELKNDTVIIDGIEHKVDISRTGEHSISIIVDGVQTDALIEKIDTTKKEISLIIQQKQYTINLKDKMDLLLQQMGLDTFTTSKVEDLKSPMPGLILQVMVTPGQAVSKGDVLIVLEAMKMENSLKAMVDAVVGNVLVSSKQVVEKGEKLITFIAK